MNVPMYSPINEHARNASIDSGVTIDVPNSANAVIIQATGQNIRMKLKGTATASQGFRITAGNDAVLMPVGSASIHVISETSGAVIEYQFVKVHGLGV